MAWGTAYESIRGGFLEEAPPEPSLKGLVEGSPVTNGGQGTSVRENSRDKVPDQKENKARKRPGTRRPARLVLAQMVHRTMLRQEACVRMAP